MLREVLPVCALWLVTTSANAEDGVHARETTSLPSAGVPTWWVLVVTGEKDGTPWMKTYTPETMGGRVRGTGAWACTYGPTQRGGDEVRSWEEMEVVCGVGEAEAFFNLRANFRSKAKPGLQPGKRWKRGEMQTLNLRQRGDSNSVTTVSLRCDLDAAYSFD